MMGKKGGTRSYYSVRNLAYHGQTITSGYAVRTSRMIRKFRSAKSFTCFEKYKVKSWFFPHHEWARVNRQGSEEGLIVHTDIHTIHHYITAFSVIASAVWLQAKHESERKPL